MASCLELLLHERAQAAEGGEGRPADFIVRNDETKALLEGGDDVHHRHGIELGERTEERRGCIESLQPPAQLQRRADHCLHLINHQLNASLMLQALAWLTRMRLRARRRPNGKCLRSQGMTRGIWNTSPPGRAAPQADVTAPSKPSSRASSTCWGP